MALNDKIPSWPEAPHANARRSRLAADLVIDGDVTSDGPVDVHGKIVGSASAPEVLVAVTGRIEGTVSAHELSVLGFVSGSVSARHIQLSPSAVVHADVLYERIVIEAGAELEGWKAGCSEGSDEVSGAVASIAGWFNQTIATA